MSLSHKQGICMEQWMRENDVQFWLFVAQCVGIELDAVVAQQMGNGMARLTVLGAIWMKARGEI